MESKNKTNFYTAWITELKNLLKNPKKLIPTFVLCGIWLVFSLMSGFGVNLPFFRFLYTLTYAKGGMLGGFFGTVGGIFGKAVFAAVVNSVVLSICAKENPFSGLQKKMKGIFTGSIFALAPLFYRRRTRRTALLVFQYHLKPRKLRRLRSCGCRCSFLVEQKERASFLAYFRRHEQVFRRKNTVCDDCQPCNHRILARLCA